MVRGSQRALAAFLGIVMITTGGALGGATFDDDEARVVDAWVDALKTRDQSVIEAMPWDHPEIASGDRALLARAVLDRLVSDDVEVAALFADPALSSAESAARYDEAVDLLSFLMFDRAGLVARVQQEAAAAYEASLAELPTEDVADTSPELVDAIRRDAEALAVLPEPIGGAIEAIMKDVNGIDLEPPGVLSVGPLASFQHLMPPGVSFAVCWLSAEDQNCVEVVPFVPMPVDVNADAMPDLLASLSLVADPTQILALLEAEDLVPQLTFRVERIPGLDTTPLQVLIVGLFVLEEDILLAGYDAFTDDAPLAAREAPQSVTIVAGASSSEDDTQARLVFQTTSTGAAFRTLAGITHNEPWDPERLLTIDTSPVPAALDLGLHAWADAEGAHFRGEIEMDRATDLVATITERDEGASEVHIARLSGDDVGPLLALEAHRGPAGEAWDWESTSTVPYLAYEDETFRFTDPSLATPLSWRRQAFELHDVPIRINVTLPGHGSVELEASAIVGAVSHTRHTYDYDTLREKVHTVSAESVPVSVAFAASDLTGSFTSVGSLGKLLFQSASLDSSPAPGAVATMLFDLSEVTTNFVGFREKGNGGAIAVQLVSLPDALAFTLGETARGIDLELTMSRGLGEVNGIVQIDERLGTLYLSNIPKQIAISAAFDKGTVTVGYDASSGINEARVLFTDLTRAADAGTVHAFVQVLQLPRSVSLHLTRAGDAPKLAYTAATSTVDVRAMVSEDLFDGDLQARALLWIDDLGASATLGLVKVSGRDTIRLTSVPPTKLIFLEGFVSQRYDNGISQHVSDDCCLDAFGYDVRYGYDIDATVKVENLRLRLTDVGALDLALRAPDLTVQGTFGEFLVTWDTINIVGVSSAWLRVDLTVLWVDINIWNWGWSSASGYDLNVQITRFANQWGPLASVHISPCSFRIDITPYPVETMTNGFRMLSLNGQRQYLFLNPIGGNGQPLVPSWLVAGYMAWQYGGWSLDLDC